MPSSSMFMLKIIILVLFCLTTIQSIKHTATTTTKSQGSNKNSATTSVDNNNNNSNQAASTTKVEGNQDNNQKQGTTSASVSTSPVSQVKKQDTKSQQVKAQPSQPSPTKQQKSSQQQQQQSASTTFLITASKTQYTLPVKIGTKTYNLGLTYSQKSDDYGKLPSWIFTNLTNTCQLCDSSQDCQEIQNIVGCSNSSRKNKQQQQQICVDQGKSKLNTAIIQSKRKIKILFTNNQKKYIYNFVSPSKVLLFDRQIDQNQIQGVFNLAMTPDQKYKNAIVLKRQQLKIMQSKQLQQCFKQKQVINLVKTGLLSLGSTKNMFIRPDLKLAQNDKKNKKQTEILNVKTEYQNTRIFFTKVDKIMAVTKNMLVVIKNILKKHYFGDRCKIKDNSIICSAAPIKKISIISLCRDQDGKHCIKLYIQDMIIKQIKADKQYQMMIQEHRLEDFQNDIILYPGFANYYAILADQGVVKGVAQVQVKIQQQIAAKTASIQSEITGQAQIQEQKQKQQVQQKQQQQKKKEQSQQQQEHKTEKQQKTQETKEDEEQQLSQKPITKSKSQKSSPSASKSQPQKHQSQQLKSTSNKGSLQQQQKYGKSILFFIFIYGLIFVTIIILIKWKAKQTIMAAMIDRCIEITWYAIVQDYFSKSRGYNAPIFQDQNQRDNNQQIDNSDSIAVGYGEKKGKNLFWENNSVEGI